MGREREASGSHQTRARTRIALTCALVAGVSACPGNFVNPDRATPVCAVRDCKSGRIIDDGCAYDGKCKACSNDCGGKVAPRNGPATPVTAR